jgi:hypothetical protein
MRQRGVGERRRRYHVVASARIVRDLVQHDVEGVVKGGVLVREARVVPAAESAEDHETHSEESARLKNQAEDLHEGRAKLGGAGEGELATHGASRARAPLSILISISSANLMV